MISLILGQHISFPPTTPLRTFIGGDGIRRLGQHFLFPATTYPRKIIGGDWIRRLVD